MKYKALACLLAASAVCSLHAVKVENQTFGEIKLHSFAKDLPGTGEQSISAIKILSFTRIDTKEHGMSVSAMTVTINGESCTYDQLTDETVLRFEETEEGDIKVLRS